MQMIDTGNHEMDEDKEPERPVEEVEAPKQMFIASDSVQGIEQRAFLAHGSRNQATNLLGRSFDQSATRRDESEC